ncbi:efflux RND transporter periplasmic adaptor subunit [Robbsia sp. Bb-Pol-6]|uniref:Efflux RND transporter periplasmic adaptor subunit n=1 Tax=Robbsia betulipollinis TaxID=2981849 RepID=A0ABT3ZGN6_9BURK|nr:efflux RND transporter periplasmic adaptor subunit [Robbsia betulipollinis]
MLVLVAAVLGAGFAIYVRHVADTGVAAPAAAVGRADIEASVRATGMIRPIRQVDVGTQASGQLRTLKVALGERVARGQLLAEIDPDLARNDVRSSQALLDEELARRRSALAERALRERKLARARDLRAADAGSQAALELAQAQFDVQRAALAEREAAILRARIVLDSARARLAQTRVVAPIDGVVTSIAIKEGQTIVATQSAQVIMTLADLSIMTVEARVSEADVTRVAPGQQSYFTVLAEPDVRYAGLLREVEPAPVRITGDSSGAIYYNALFDVDNASGRLRAMMTANVRIVQDSASQALVIPILALDRPLGPDVAEVRVAGPKGGVTRKVRLGLRSDTHVEVREGLSEGERVLLADGAS